MLTRTIFGVLLATSALGASAAELRGYLVDGSGQAVRAGAGGCIRSGSWAASTPGIGCDATPDRVVLLPEPDGRVGAVVVRAGGTERVIDTAYAGAEVAGTQVQGIQEDAARVQARYGALLGSAPPRPLSLTVYFAAGSATELTPESLPVIEQIKASLAARPAPEVVVIGHTDRVGKLEANDTLSRKRAEQVRDILGAAGVSRERMDVAGRGEREPVVATADEVAEARNRRVEVNIR